MATFQVSAHYSSVWSRRYHASGAMNILHGVPVAPLATSGLAAQCACNIMKSNGNIALCGVPSDGGARVAATHKVQSMCNSYPDLPMTVAERFAIPAYWRLDLAHSECERAGRATTDVLPTTIATVPPQGTGFPVGGLRCLQSYELFRFRDFLLCGQQKRFYMIGRSPRCDIALDDTRVSNVHAFIERHADGTHTLIDYDSTNGLFVIVGDRIERVTRVPLVVGLFVLLGRSLLIAVTEDGRAPLSAFTETEFRREAYRVYGSLQAAAAALGKSRETIRRAIGRLRKGKGKDG
jgi:hypothetical protein